MTPIYLACVATLVAGCQTGDDRPATLELHPRAIIQPSCTTAGCHSALTAIAGVNLADREGAYTVLTGQHLRRAAVALRSAAQLRHPVQRGVLAARSISCAADRMAVSRRDATGHAAARRRDRAGRALDRRGCRMRLSSLALFVVLARGERADAYPQFQLSLGPDRCTACHFSPAGGGLLNDYGRDEAGSTISRGGDGRFLARCVDAAVVAPARRRPPRRRRDQVPQRASARCSRSRCRPTSTSAPAASAFSFNMTAGTARRRARSAAAVRRAARVARALPHVSAREWLLRARRSVLSDLRHPLARSHRVRSALPRLSHARGAVRRRRRDVRRHLGGARLRVRAASDRVSRLRHQGEGASRRTTSAGSSTTPPRSRGRRGSRCRRPIRGSSAGHRRQALDAGRRGDVARASSICPATVVRRRRGPDALSARRLSRARASSSPGRDGRRGGASLAARSAAALGARCVRDQRPVLPEGAPRAPPADARQRRRRLRRSRASSPSSSSTTTYDRDHFPSSRSLAGCVPDAPATPSFQQDVHADPRGQLRALSRLPRRSVVRPALMRLDSYDDHRRRRRTTAIREDPPGVSTRIRSSSTRVGSSERPADAAAVPARRLSRSRRSRTGPPARRRRRATARRAAPGQSRPDDRGRSPIAGRRDPSCSWSPRSHDDDGDLVAGELRARVGAHRSVRRRCPLGRDRGALGYGGDRTRDRAWKLSADRTSRRRRAGARHPARHDRRSEVRDAHRRARSRVCRCRMQRADRRPSRSATTRRGNGSTSRARRPVTPTAIASSTSTTSPPIPRRTSRSVRRRARSS